MKRLGKKTLIPLVIALALVLGGAIGAFGLTSSGLPYESQDYRAQFYLNHLQVHLLENGRDVCNEQNDLNGENKVSGDLVQYLGYSRLDNADGAEKLGSVQPGMLYEEKIQAENGQDVPIYVRLTVRKYWMKEDEETGEMVKATDLSPKLIHLMYGKSDYNSDAWFMNENESTDEQKIYYYKEQVDPVGKTDPLFDSLVIDSSMNNRELMDKEVVSYETVNEVRTIKYKYTYDGYAFFIKADVQAIQTHNAEDAIHSQWGVYDIVEKDGRLSLK